MLELRQLRDFDWKMLAAAIVLALIGILMIHSATHSPDYARSSLVERQLYWGLFSLIALGMALLVSHDTLEAFSYVLYAVAALLLVAVLIVGVGKLGERRWFQFGPINFQPSELAKYAVVFALARYLAARKTGFDRPGDLLVPFLIVLVPTVLVLREPDLGTSIIFLLILLPMLYWAGMRPLGILLLVTPLVSLTLAFNWVAWAVFIALLAWFLYASRLFVVDKVIVLVTNVVMGQMSPLVWARLEEYQRHRVLAFLNPEKYRLGTGYQLIQSKIAVGSGQALGKGFLNGTQKKFAFLPEQHTDFIFSVVGEEFGFIGCLVVLGLYAFLIARMLRLASQMRNRFAALSIVGIAAILFFQTALNVGVTLGLVPVTGMTLPFLSYGGSSLVVTMGSIGLVLGMGMRRREY